MLYFEMPEQTTRFTIMGIFKAILKSWTNPKNEYDTILIVETDGKGFTCVGKEFKGSAVENGFKGMYFTVNELTILQ